MALTPRSVFRYFKVDGVPSSGKHDPVKAEIIQLLEQMFGVSHGGWVVTQTRAALNGVTPEEQTDGGVVLNDANPANNGYYSRSGGAWVFGRGFPDTFARVALSGSGSAQTGAVNTGVNPASIEVFFAKVATVNTGPLSLSVGGGPVRPVVNLAGNPLSAGEWTGMVMFYLNDASQYQLLIDAGAAASAAASASVATSEADRAEQALADALAMIVPDGAVTFPKLSDALVQTDAEGGDDEADDQILTVKRVSTIVKKISAYTPERFGCIGDGVTDDTANFMLALDAAGEAGVELVLDKGKTYLVSTWAANGYYPTGEVSIRGARPKSTIKGPDTAAYFLRPTTKFSIEGVRFERWVGILRKDVGEVADIIGARFVGNECTDISGIPLNFECPLVETLIANNLFENNGGGYQIRIGTNEFAKQDTWARNEISHNIIRNIVASGATSGFAIIVYGKDTKILFNTIIGMTATDGEAIGIYTKLRNGQVIGNRVSDLISTGTAGAALDNVGISIKGGGRAYAGPGVQGYGCIVADNIVENVGVQGVKGGGIRVQTEFCIVANNLVKDTGLTGIVDDESNGSNDNLIIGNRVEGYNKLGVYGIMVSTFGAGHKVIANTIVNFIQAIRVSSAGGFPLSHTKVMDNSVRSTRANSYGVVIAGATPVRGIIIAANDFSLTGATSTAIRNDIGGGLERCNVTKNEAADTVAAGGTFYSGTAADLSEGNL